MFKITLFSLFEIMETSRFNIEPDDSISCAMELKIPHFKLSNASILGKTVKAVNGDENGIFDVILENEIVRVPHWLCKDIICLNCSNIIQ